MQARQPAIGAVKRAFDVVELLVEEGELGVVAVAEELDIPPSTAHDHLQTLECLGYLVNREEGYGISTRFLEIGGQDKFDRDFFQVAKPELQKLAKETGEHAPLLIEEELQGVVLHTETGDQAVKLLSPAGTHNHLHATAMGKAILAHLPEDSVDEMIDRHGLPALTDGTITDRERLFEELAEIEETGYALDEQEIIDGLRGIAAPVLDLDGGTHGAIGVYGPASRIDDELFEAEIPRMVMEASNVIEVNINY